jgi:hypothetical protein
LSDISIPKLLLAVLFDPDSTISSINHTPYSSSLCLFVPVVGVVIDRFESVEGGIAIER